MKESRIERLSEEQAREAASRAGLPEAMAPLNVFRVLLHHPELAKAISGLLTMLLFRGKLERRLRELVIMRIGWQTGSVYEWTQHWRVALQLDVSEADLLAVRDWRNSDLGEAERAVLQATDDCLERGAISAGAWRACERALPGREELLELVAAIGNWSLFSQLLQSLEIPLEDGVTPWPPDGERPGAAGEQPGRAR
jgi:alkylhydroperoxidase family enzyme